ncbi:hypothetical protein BKA81DRAFT_373399 [Phyllosticta paracitricarpa]
MQPCRSVEHSMYQALGQCLFLSLSLSPPSQPFITPPRLCFSRHSARGMATPKTTDRLEVKMAEQRQQLEDAKASIEQMSETLLGYEEEIQTLEEKVQQLQGELAETTRQRKELQLELDRLSGRKRNA